MPYSKAFKEANPELIKQRQKEANERYAVAHPDVVAKAKADWYQDNRDKEIARVAKWKESNPDKVFAGHLRRKYGITLDQYNELLVLQGGVCGICKGLPVGKTKNGKPSSRYDVDHDHATGKVRGLLCHSCNVMLGQARDRIDVLNAAILWLGNHAG